MAEKRVLSPQSNKAFTMVEVAIAATVALVLVLAIIAGLVYNQRASKMTRERTNAQRRAAELIEHAKRFTFNDMVEVSWEEVLIDDNRTVAADDNLLGQRRLRIFRAADRDPATGEFDDADALPIADGEDYVVLQADVQWTSMGRQQEITLLTELAP